MRRSIGPCGAGYCESEQEVVRGPYGSYENGYRVQEYDYPSRPHHHHHGGGYAGGVAEVVSYESNPGYLGHHHNHHHHGGVAEVIEKREEIIYDNASDPYRRMY